jgi:hypothetical protein
MTADWIRTNTNTGREWDCADFIGPQSKRSLLAGRVLVSKLP